jgi:hypothetical protein
MEPGACRGNYSGLGGSNGAFGIFRAGPLVPVAYAALAMRRSVFTDWTRGRLLAGNPHVTINYQCGSGISTPLAIPSRKHREGELRVAGHVVQEYVTGRLGMRRVRDVMR